MSVGPYIFAMTDDEYRGTRRTIEAAARTRGIDDPDREGGPRVARVPESHAHDTFDVDGLDTTREESLLEAILADVDGVSAASATQRNGTVGVHHDPSVSRADLRETLESCGLVVAPGDEAFASRRASQFASARVAVAVLFGLMVATPYIGVMYPTRVEWLFYDPVTVAYLQSILDSQVATHFFVNLAALSGIAFVVACGPTIRRAGAAAAEGRVTNELAFVAGVCVVFGYSTLAAFTGFGGNVHYDLVAYAVAGVTVWRRFVADAADTPLRQGTTAERGVDTDADDDPVALTDGGR
jgi:cation transport ATPase